MRAGDRVRAREGVHRQKGLNVCWCELACEQAPVGIQECVDRWAGLGWDSVHRWISVLVRWCTLTLTLVT